VQADAIEQRRRFRVHVAALERAHHAAALVAEEDVRGDVEVAGEHELLVDERDAVALGLAHVREHDRSAVDGNLSLVRQVSAAEDLHEGALARAVLAHERQDFARVERERNARKRDYAWEAFHDPAHREQRAT
jgi:hypothetical protein